MKSFITIMFTEAKRQARISKGLFAFCLFLCTSTALLALSYTVLLNRLIETLANATQIHGAKKQGLYLFGIFVMVILLREVLNGVLNYFLDKQQMTLQGGLKLHLFNRIGEMDVLSFEDPTILDRINKAKAGIESTTLAFMYLELILANGLLYLVLISMYMLSIHPLLSIVLLAVFLPTVISYLVKNKIIVAVEERSAVVRRRMDLMEASICDRAYFKETRSLGALGFFKDKFNNIAKTYRSFKGKEAQKLSIIQFFVDVTQFIGFLLTFAVLYYLVMTKQIGVGTIAAVIATISLVYSYLKEFFGNQLAGITNSYSGVHNFHVLMEESRRPKGKQEEVQIDRLDFKNVSFRYPNADVDALKNINLTLYAGETVCVVGENGSGKSTLSKLILGLYSATEGEISINGDVIIKRDNLSSLRQRTSSVFQAFNRYNISVADNISIGNVQEPSHDQMKNSLTETGLDELIDKLPQGLNTMLSKEFDGVDLSGGEWQRIAIARGLMKIGDVIVFDEPTSAIDSLLELDLLQRMLDVTGYRMKVIITHRIGIATKADRILVLKNGRMIEDGTHKELMKAEGEYYTLFKKQSEWYH